MEVIYCSCPLCPIFIATKHSLGIELNSELGLEKHNFYILLVLLNQVFVIRHLYTWKKGTLIINNLVIQDYKLVITLTRNSSIKIWLFENDNYQ